jgi:glycosyltransferase involved in cell wall biosynthesis
MGRRTRDWLARLEPQPDVVILYAGFAAYLSRLLPWCRRRRIPLVFDAVEWYEPSSMPGGRFGPYRWSFELSARDLCVRCGNVIAISSYLREYYDARGCLTVRVPPTLDLAALPPLPPPVERDGVTIGFAGSPGAGRAFDTIVDAIVTLAEQGRRIRLRVAGATAEHVLRCPALASRGLARLPDCLDVVGPVPHAEAIALMRDVDFTALVRPVKRYSTAAFPTKVVESLAVGTPVICNLTSDLGEHLVDGREALLCRDSSRDGLIAALERALALGRDVHRRMRVAARARAEAAFDYRRFAAPIGDFLERAVRRAQAA